MAITAVITLTPSSLSQPTSANAGMPITFNVGCAVSNSGGSNVTVTGVHPTCVTASGAAAPVSMGKPPITPGLDVTVPASG